MIIHTNENNSILTFSKINLSKLSNLQKKIIRQSAEDDLWACYYDRTEKDRVFSNIPMVERHNFIGSYKSDPYRPVKAFERTQKYLSEVSKCTYYKDSVQSFDFNNNIAHFLLHSIDDYGNFIDKYEVATCEMIVPGITKLFIDALTNGKRLINLSEIFTSQQELKNVEWILDSFNDAPQEKMRKLSDICESFALFYYEIFPHITEEKSYSIEQLQHLRELATSCKIDDLGQVDALLKNIPLAKQNEKILTLAKKR